MKKLYQSTGEGLDDRGWMTRAWTTWQNPTKQGPDRWLLNLRTLQYSRCDIRREIPAGFLDIWRYMTLLLRRPILILDILSMSSGLIVA
ncbi:hypothetical protein Pcinc_030144 [Petrolisthes cinctipes]|uniref:Uncharacterized protein n=1 Tax=Petrolisthes cinctipes TaxID=88211 RepID=A0AAE1K6E4_PETCI|nr:hypothetical protein Pcinc_030144 [Petrolisthes cinctipes]